MPVSPRSQISGYCEQDESAMGPIKRLKNFQERAETNPRFRNPHHGLKEKMKELTLLYEQQKLARNNLNQISRQEAPLRFGSHTSVDLLGFSRTGNHELKDLKGEHSLKCNTVGQIMKEKTVVNSTVTRTYVLPQPRPKADDLKENVGIETERVLGFATCPTKKAPVVPANIVRRLSMGGGAGAKNFLETTEKSEADAKEKCGSSGSGILVFVRLRPMSRKEKDAGSKSCVRIVNRRDLYLTEFSNENDYLRLKRLQGRHFTFDAAFPDSTTQPEVYSTSTAELVEAVLQGNNGSVFCYGATGAGKTYTMLGTIENPGVMVLAIKDVFTKIRQRSCDGNHVVHLSYLEVYNETVRDLISPGRPLVLREDKQGIVAAGLTQYRAYSTDEIMALLLRGNQNRTTEPTRANETSSRSHAILQVVVEYQVRDAAMNVVNRVGKLSLIDLAGSERALVTDQRTLRSIEGANINRSLLALSSCINALVEGKKHIPYRNSKLTQLLKDSLGGSCNTVMIANISPSNLSFGETQITLHWADRAKEIRNKECDVNEEIIEMPQSEVDQAKLLLELQKQNRELRVQLARQQQKLLSLQAQALATAQSSPAPSSVTSLLTPSTTVRVEKRRTRSSFLSANCFTPEMKKGADNALSIKELKNTVKALESEMEKMKKDHALQMKQKDDHIKEILRKGEKLQQTREGVKRIVTRSSLRPKKPVTDELKSPSSRFKSPILTAKKRSFWDITTGNSPSVSGRKTRSHVALEPPAAAAVHPSMLLQPGFACKKTQRLDLK